jgi:uncharacterized protein (DUF934 family)
MSKPIVIEVRGEPLGVVVPSEEGFRFVAVKFPVFDIDGRIYETVDEARSAASAVISRRRPQLPLAS